MEEKNNNEQADCCNEPKRKINHLLNIQLRIKYWIFLNIWCSRLYRPTMKILHKFNLHYAPPNFLMSSFENEYGEINHWCQWCGLRGTTYRPDPKKGLFITKEEPHNKIWSCSYCQCVGLKPHYDKKSRVPLCSKCGEIIGYNYEDMKDENG